MSYKENRKKYQFYIDRKGKVHKYAGNTDDVISIHYQIAHKIYPKEERPEDRLLNEGWVLCGSSVYNCPIIHKKPTQAQIDKLFDLELFDRLCFLHDNSYPNYKKYGILIS